MQQDFIDHKKKLWINCTIINSSERLQKSILQTRKAKFVHCPYYVPFHNLTSWYRQLSLFWLNAVIPSSASSFSVLALFLLSTAELSQNSLICHSSQRANQSAEWLIFCMDKTSKFSPLKHGHFSITISFFRHLMKWLSWVKSEFDLDALESLECVHRLWLMSLRIRPHVSFCRTSKHW
jgi:hypothetical protein